jgi:2-oxo-4-hydroxy-4-carboxy--5-ureidoimidazoline (OHCU) decarboxylase
MKSLEEKKTTLFFNIPFIAAVHVFTGDRLVRALAARSVSKHDVEGIDIEAKS